MMWRKAYERDLKKMGLSHTSDFKYFCVRQMIAVCSDERAEESPNSRGQGLGGDVPTGARTPGSAMRDSGHAGTHASAEGKAHHMDYPEIRFRPGCAGPTVGDCQ